MMPWATGSHRVRRIGKSRFGIVNPDGDYVGNAKGNRSEYSTFAAAISALKEFQSGIRKEPHPLLEDDK
jgi:hypothetical protein